ncbi:hypothetical protein, conserved, partial [Eimeria tenella]
LSDCWFFDLLQLQWHSRKELWLLPPSFWMIEGSQTNAPGHALHSASLWCSSSSSSSSGPKPAAVVPAKQQHKQAPQQQRLDHDAAKRKFAAAAEAAPEGGSIIIFGGVRSSSSSSSNSSNEAYLTNEVFRLYPEERVWRRLTTKGSSPEPRMRHSAGVFRDSLFVYGGRNAQGDACADCVYQLDLVTMSWAFASVASSGPDAFELSACTVALGSLVVLGGRCLDSSLSNSVFCFPLGRPEAPKRKSTVPRLQKN